MRWVAVACLIGLAAGLSAYTPDQLSDVNERLSLKHNLRLMSTTRAVVDDGIPRVAVKFDDGDDGQFDNNEVQAFLRRSIPVTLALNTNSIGDATHMTVRQIREIQDFAWRHNTDLGISVHTASNWGGSSPWTLTPGQITAEIDPSRLESLFGVDVTVFTYPGGGTNVAWAQRNRDILSSMLKAHGFKYALAPSSDPDSTGFLFHTPHIVADDTETAARGALRAIRPGMLNDPYWMWSGMGDVDLGNTVVERDGTEGSGSSSFLIRNQTGGDTKANWKKTWAYKYGALLAAGAGFVFSAHESVRTDAVSIDIGNGSQAYPGHYSPNHIAWTLRKLADAGHIKLVTVEEWCEWALARYAPGTDLIANPKFLLPQFDIGDTNGAEYGWARGLGTFGHASSAWNVLEHSLDGGWDAGAGNAAKYDRASDDPDDDINSSIKGWMGSSGGWAITSGVTHSLGVAMMPPGRYRFSFATNNVGAIVIEELHLSAAGNYYEPEPSWEAGGASSYGDTLLTYKWKDASVTFDSGVWTTNGTAWTVKGFEFTVPRAPVWLFQGVVSATVDAVGLFGDTDEQSGSSTASAYQRLWLDQWTWSLTLALSTSASGMVLSHPQLVYLGEW